MIVTQPARVATVEARKAGQMFASLGVPVLGVVENMTGPFGAGGGQAVSLELEVPFLGSLSFDEIVVREGNAGIPTVIARPDSPISACFDQIAQRVAEQLGWERMASARTTFTGKIPAPCD